MTPAKLRNALISAGLALLIAAPGPSRGEISLPDIGNPANQSLSPGEEQRLGETLLRQIRRELPLVQDPELKSYMESLGYRLVSSSPDAHAGFNFLLVNAGSINAFAAPGGIVAVNAGLVRAARSESELAAVIAHEIAHVTQRHIARMYAKSGTIDLATGIATIAAILASAYSSEVGQAAMYSAMAGNIQSKLGFSRDHEREADHHGIQILSNAGYDPEAMPRFFERMDRLTYAGNAAPEFLRTHPVTANRISDSRSRADRMKGDWTDDSLSFRFAQARLAVLAGDPHRIAGDLQTRAEAEGLSLVTRYELALALDRSGRSQEALSLLEGLTEAHDEHLPLRLAHTEALMSLGRYQQAAKRLEQLNELYPGHRPVVHHLAQAWIRTGRGADALALVDEALRSDPGTPDPQMIKLKAEAADKAGRKAIAHEAMATYYVAFGRYGEALQQIELALEQADLKEVTRQRLKTRRQDIKKEREEAEAA